MVLLCVKINQHRGAMIMVVIEITRDNRDHWDDSYAQQDVGDSDGVDARDDGDGEIVVVLG